MINKKQIITILSVIALACISFADANESESNGGYKTPIVTDSFNFTATLNDGNNVYMQWNRFDSFSDKSLNYYKVIRSSDNVNPVYPDDWYIKYCSEMSCTSYTDNSPKEWINYYRVCAITSDLNRYCSNVVKINIQSSSTKSTSMANPASTYCVKLWGTSIIQDGVGWQVGYCKLPSGQVCEEWKLYKWECKLNKEEKKNNSNSSLNEKVNALILKFKAKLNEKYSTDNTKKIAAINTAITKLEALKVAKPNMWTIIDLTIEKLKTLLTEVDTQDIENILNLED